MTTKPAPLIIGARSAVEPPPFARNVDREVVAFGMLCFTHSGVFPLKQYWTDTAQIWSVSGTRPRHRAPETRTICILELPQRGRGEPTIALPSARGRAPARAKQ